MTCRNDADRIAEDGILYAIKTEVPKFQSSSLDLSQNFTNIRDLFFIVGVGWERIGQRPLREALIYNIMQQGGRAGDG